MSKYYDITKNLDINNASTCKNLLKRRFPYMDDFFSLVSKIKKTFLRPVVSSTKKVSLVIFTIKFVIIIVFYELSMIVLITTSWLHECIL